MNFFRVVCAVTCGLILVAVKPSASAAPASAVQVSNERRLNFDADWRFFKGEADGAEQPTFDDSRWTTLRLPHDWAIDGPFDPS